MRAFRAEVVKVAELSPSLRRITFGGPDLAEFVSTGCPDECVRVLVADEGQHEPALPRIINGALDYASINPDRLRIYTVRQVDPAAGEVTIDFVVHTLGAVTGWAREAGPGDVAALSSPSGNYAPPPDLAWQVLVADNAGLPALARILEQTPDEVSSRVIVEVPGPEHQIPLPDHPGAHVGWRYGGNGVGPSRLEEAVRSLPAPDRYNGYLWVAGEGRTLRGVRRYVRRELGLPSSRYKVVGYWIDNAEHWRERYDALGPEDRRSLEALWESDRPAEEIEADYDERLAELGL